MDLNLRKLSVWIILCLALTAATQLYAHGQTAIYEGEGPGAMMARLWQAAGKRKGERLQAKLPHGFLA